MRLASAAAAEANAKLIDGHFAFPASTLSRSRSGRSQCEADRRTLANSLQSCFSRPAAEANAKLIDGHLYLYVDQTMNDPRPKPMRS